MKRIFINQALENIRKKHAIIQSSDDLENLSDIMDDSTDYDQMYNISENELL